MMERPPVGGKVATERQIEAIGVTEWTLSNGVRVVVKPTRFDPGQIAIEGFSPGGLAQASLPELPAAMMSNGVATAGGFGNHNQKTFAEILAGNQVKVNVEISETEEKIGGSSSVQGFETLLQAMYLRMTAPRRDDRAIAAWKKAAEQRAAQNEDPEERFYNELRSVYFAGNPRKLNLRPAEIAAVDPDSALAFDRSRFGDAGDFTFVVVGDVDPERLKPLIATYLGGLPARDRKDRKEVKKDAGVRRASGKISKEWNFYSEPKARVVLTFHGDSKWTEDNALDMIALNYIVSKQLQDVLGKKLGNVDSLRVGGELTREGHQERHFTVEIDCGPEQVDELIKNAMDEVEKLRSNGPNPKHLNDFKDEFLRILPESLQTNDLWLEILADYARFGDDPVADSSEQKAVELVNSVTPARLKAAAKNFLDPSRFVQGVLRNKR